MIERLKQQEDLSDMKFIIDPPAETKMSEVILGFAEPLLDRATDYEEKESLISLIILAWNLSLMPLILRVIIFQRVKAEMKRDREGFLLLKTFIKMIRQYRKDNYPGLKRYILDFEFTETDDDIHLNVVSTVSPPKG